MIVGEPSIFELPSPLTVESGAVLTGVKVAYNCWGTLNEAKSNAVLICHALTGSSQVTHHEGDSPSGWWHQMVGPGKAIDTRRYFVICANVLGSCKGSTGPASINPETGQVYGTQFPIVTIQDMVQVQYALIRELGITCLHAVVGPSMGGMQALQWAIAYPDALKQCVVIAASASVSPQALAFAAVGRHAIVADAAFKQGNYGAQAPKQGLAVARMIGHITYISQQSIQQKFGRKLQDKHDYGYNTDYDFQIESYLKHQGDKFVDQFDANSYLYLSKALSYFDLEKQYGSIQAAVTQIKARLLLLSISSDWLYPTAQLKAIAQACMMAEKQISFCEISSQFGHDSFLIDPDPFAQVMAPFLASTHPGECHE